MRNKQGSFRYYVLSVLIALVLTLALVIIIMQPPVEDLVFLVVLLGITAVGSSGFGFLFHRLGWWSRPRRLAYSMTLGYLFASALTLLNVWVTARLMFINQHDLILATLLLLFASAISVAFGYFLSSSLTRSLSELARGAEQLSRGDFSARVEVEGNDEVAQLAALFNSMASRLEQARKAEQDLDSMRRDLVAWVSHDLRTPLASLRAMLDALAEGVVTDEETVARYVRQSQAEVSRMSLLIDDLFELAQLDAGYLELHGEYSSLPDLLSDTLGTYAARARLDDVALSGSVSPEVDLVWMAPDKISRALHNLIENALRHTPSGGKVEIQAKSHDDDSVLVSIRDTGEGISPEDLPHVFDRFYRGEKSRSRSSYETGGSGLGLAIAKGVVEAHEGHIWVESRPGEGTTVKFTLPKPGPRSARLEPPGY